jgi:LysM repeat protein
VDRTRVRWGRVGALLCVAATVGGVTAGAVDRSGVAPAGRAVVYTVRPGDTVWTIARRAVGAEGDPRPVAHELVERNGIVDGVIHPGQAIVVPGRRG